MVRQAGEVMLLAAWLCAPRPQASSVCLRVGLGAATCGRGRRMHSGFTINKPLIPYYCSPLFASYCNEEHPTSENSSEAIRVFAITLLGFTSFYEANSRTSQCTAHATYEPLYITRVLYETLAQ